MQGLRHVESFAIRFLAGQAAVASLAGTRLRTTRSPRPGQPAPLLQRCRARNTETHHRLRLTHPTVNHSPRCGDLGLIVVSRPLYSHDKKPTPPDHAVHLLPLSHSLSRHTKPPGGQTVAAPPLEHLHRLLPKQTIMPHIYIHRHEKPPIPWTSISMSKKREAVHARVGVALESAMNVCVLTCLAHPSLACTSGWWHATRCVSSVRRGCTLHSSPAKGQRGRKRQPFGGLTALGGSPSSLMARSS